MSLEKDVTVIFLSVGERTEGLCYHRMCQEIPEENIEWVKGYSLYDSKRISSIKAADAGRKYVLVMDADMIPRIGMIQDMYDMAKSMSGKWVFVKGTVIDKFVMEMRGDQGGPMLYPLEVIADWVNILPDITNRLNTAAKLQGHYKNKGYKTLRSPLFLALHDYEQHYHDIYRNQFIYAKKLKKVVELLPIWKRLAKKDVDYEVARYAYRQGMKHEGELISDYKYNYGFSSSPFSKWEPKPEIKDFDFDISKYEHLKYGICQKQ